MNYYERIQESIEYIEKNLEGEIDLKRVAQEAYMSLANFHRLFFALTGYSVKEYIRLRRLSLAAIDILYSDMRIIDIAVKYGFESADSFSRTFKRITGVLPSVFRIKKLSFSIERINIMEKYFEIQDEDLLEKYPDIKVLKELPSMKVAYYKAYSEHPEIDGFRVMYEWAKCNNLITDSRSRIFGFDLEDPITTDGKYGYEVWLTIDVDFVFTDKKVKCKMFEGGLYAVTSTSVSEVVNTWNRFRAWLKISKYDLGSHQFLEEHLFNDWEKHNELLDTTKLDLYMPIVLKSNKRREDIKPVKVAYYRAKDLNTEKAAMEVWNVMLSWARKNNLQSQNHKVYVYNQGFKKVKTYWQEIMITIDSDFIVDDEKVKTKIFEGGTYMGMPTKLSSLGEAWHEMNRWSFITKSKMSKHQWIEEWVLDGWNFPEKGISVLFPIKD